MELSLLLLGLGLCLSKLVGFLFWSVLKLMVGEICGLLVELNLVVERLF